MTTQANGSMGTEMAEDSYDAQQPLPNSRKVYICRL